MKKCAIYIRVSTTHQIDKDSLPFQKNELVNYCKYALNIDNFEVFEDAGYSGKDTDRPGYQNMITRVKQREFTHLLIWKLDRISRNLLDFAAMYEMLKKYDVTFISRSEQFDTSSAMGEAMLKIILVFAELERKLTAERVYSIMLSRAEKGKWNGANVPFGYVWDDETKFPKPDPIESEYVIAIFNKYLETRSALSVSKYLSKNHIQTKRGGKWGSKTVCDIIRNPFYKGTYRYNYRSSARGQKKKEDEWIIVEDNHAAIIPKETWDMCNAIMDKNAERNSASFREKSHIHIFSKKLVCSSCGSILIASLDRPRKDGYTPSKYVCKSKSIGSGCDQKMISEITLGPFIINYLSNLYKSFQADIMVSLDSLEKQLLSGPIFDDVHSISYGLDETLRIIKECESYSFTNSNSHVSKKPKKAIDTNSNHNEINKLKRALERLENLFLFDDESMSEKDYLVKRKIISDKLDGLLKLSRKEVKPHQSLTDILLSQLSEYLFLTKFTQSSPINFREIDLPENKQLIKNFIESTIDSVVIKDGRVNKIIFHQGITHEFQYK